MNKQQTARRSSLIPSGPHKPRRSFFESSHAIQGPPGIGKTTIANSIVSTMNGGEKEIRPLFLATESGTHLMEAAEIPIPDWKTYLRALDQLETLPHPYRTIVLDTVDNLVARCTEHVCGVLGVNHPREVPYMGYDQLKAEFRRGIHRLAGLRNKDGAKLCPVFIAHTKEEPITREDGGRAQPTGRVYVRSALPPWSQGILHDAIDFLYGIHLDADGKRWLVTQTLDWPKQKPEIRYQAKSRGTPAAQLPAMIPMNFDALRGAFDRTFGGHNGEDRNNGKQ